MRLEELKHLRRRTEDLLREWQQDVGNPMRGWGELDCLIELKILQEMEMADENGK